MGSINDSVYSSVFFFLTGLHFFHLLLGLFLLGLFFWGCSLQKKILYIVNLRVSEIHLFYNLQLFYWHFLEILWIFIFLVFYNYFPDFQSCKNAKCFKKSCYLQSITATRSTD